MPIQYLRQLNMLIHRRKNMTPHFALISCRQLIIRTYPELDPSILHIFHKRHCLASHGDLNPNKRPTMYLTCRQFNDKFNCFYYYIGAVAHYEPWPFWRNFLASFRTKMTVFWVVVPCILTQINRHFICVRCLHHHDGHLKSHLPEFAFRPLCLEAFQEISVPIYR
jgi:hypothetical protein